MNNDLYQLQEKTSSVYLYNTIGCTADSCKASGRTKKRDTANERENKLHHTFLKSSDRESIWK